MGLVVDGIGEIKTPLTDEQVRQLIARSCQEPFGRGSETVVDTTIRNTWEIDASQFSFQEPNWLDNRETTRLDWIYHVLDHEYTEASLSLNALKGADLERLQALTSISENPDFPFVVFLALLDQRQVGSSLPDYSYYGGSGQHTMDHIYDSTLSVRKLVDLQGRHIASALKFDYEDLLDEDVFDDRKPDEDSYGGSSSFTGTDGKMLILMALCFEDPIGFIKDNIVRLIDAKANPLSFSLNLMARIKHYTSSGLLQPKTEANRLNYDLAKSFIRGAPILEAASKAAIAAGFKRPECVLTGLNPQLSTVDPLKTAIDPKDLIHFYESILPHSKLVTPFVSYLKDSIVDTHMHREEFDHHWLRCKTRAAEIGAFEKEDLKLLLGEKMAEVVSAIDVNGARMLEIEQHAAEGKLVLPGLNAQAVANRRATGAIAPSDGGSRVAPPQLAGTKRKNARPDRDGIELIDFARDN